MNTGAQSDPAGEMRPNTAGRTLAIMVGLVVLAFLACGRALPYGYCDMDDGLYVVRNAQVQAGLEPSGVLWALSPQIGHWHPLTWWTLMADTAIFGQSPAGHRGVNVLLHAANALILYHLLRRMTGAVWHSAIVAALFAVHPLHVEPVVWISSRKDVLSTFFLFLMLLAYLRYFESPSVGRYGAVVVLFLLGLASKTMLVTAPLLLLLIDWWPLQRFGRDQIPAWRSVRPLVIEKVPLFLLSGFGAGMAFLAARLEKVIGEEDRFPLGVRAANAVYSCGRYVVKTVWPLDLAIFYPHPGASLALWRVGAAAALLLLLSVLAILLVRRCPYLATGWLWFVIGLLPVIGILQIGSHGMADRYAYVPVLGLFVAAVWGVADLLRRMPRGQAVASLLAGVLIVAFTAQSWVQSGYWHDGVTLFSHALRVTQDNAVSRNNLGFALLRGGHTDEALQQFDAALRIHPEHVDSLVNKAVALGSLQRVPEAEACLRKAVQLRPDDAFVRFNLGIARLQQGDPAGAAEQFAEAVKLDSEDVQAHVALAQAYAQLGKTREALEQAELALRIAPGDATAQNLAASLRTQLPPTP